MTIIFKKTDIPEQIERKMRRAITAAARKEKKKKGFPAHKFAGKLKGVYGDALA